MNLLGREEGERSEQGRRSGGRRNSSLPGFPEELWFRIILLVGVLVLNLNLLLVITDNVY